MDERVYKLPNGKVIPAYKSGDKNNAYVNFVKVEYVKGICAGRIQIVDEKYVKDVIAKGFARIIE